jgi:predicted DCC family thiol-disulfide oxidoreductase YuxK
MTTDGGMENSGGGGRAPGDEGRAALTTYYNGACPVCSREIGHYRRLGEIDRAAGGPLGWCDVAASPDALAAFGIDQAAAKRRLHVVDGTGRLHVGVDAFALLWETLPRYRPLAAIVRHRTVRPAATWLYDRVLAPALVALDKRRERRRTAL